MKPILFITVLFTTPFLLWGQSPFATHTGKEMKAGKNANSVVSVVTPTSIYTFDSQYGTANIARFYNRQYAVTEAKISLGPKKEKRRAQKLFLLKDALYLLTKREDFAAKQIVLETIQLDPITLEAGKLQPFCVIPFHSEETAGYYETDVSDDTTQFLLFYDRNETFYYKVWDHTRSLVWESEVEKPVLAAYCESSLFARNGDILTLLYGPTEQEGFNQPYLYGLSPGGKQLEPIELAGEEDHLLAFSYRQATENELIGTVPYVDWEERKGEREITGYGLLYQRVDLESRKPIVSQKIPYPPAFFKTARGLQGQPLEFNLVEIIERGDGGAMVFVEQFYRGLEPGFSVVSYVNLSILVMSISPEGEIEWHQIIPKYQTFIRPNRQLGSFVVMPTRKKVYLFFNGHERDLEVELGQTQNKRAPFPKVILGVGISPDGKIDRFVLKDRRGGSFYLNSRYMAQQSATQAALYTDSQLTAEITLGNIQHRFLQIELKE